MLCIGETFEQRKDFLWSFIHVCQDLIKAIQKCKTSDQELSRTVIKQERAIIKETYEELKELQRWFKQSGLKPDEPYFKKGVNNVTE